VGPAAGSSDTTAAAQWSAITPDIHLEVKLLVTGVDELFGTHRPTSGTGPAPVRVTVRSTQSPQTSTARSETPVCTQTTSSETELDKRIPGGLPTRKQFPTGGGARYVRYPPLATLDVWPARGIPGRERM
jgi:hypothetical protein